MKVVMVPTVRKHRYVMTDRISDNAWPDVRPFDFDKALPLGVTRYTAPWALLRDEAGHAWLGTRRPYLPLGSSPGKTAQLVVYRPNEHDIVCWMLDPLAWEGWEPKPAEFMRCECSRGV